MSTEISKLAYNLIHIDSHPEQVTKVLSNRPLRYVISLMDYYFIKVSKLGFRIPRDLIIGNKFRIKLPASIKPILPTPQIFRDNYRVVVK